MGQLDKKNTRIRVGLTGMNISLEKNIAKQLIQKQMQWLRGKKKLVRIDRKQNKLVVIMSNSKQSMRIRFTSHEYCQQHW